MNNKQLSSLNELRGLAALYVFFSHIPACGILGRELGNYGVGIFYLLSAFLTLYNAKPGIATFLKKRAVRILPLYWFMTIFTFVVCKVSPSWFNTTIASIPNLVKSFFFIPYATPVAGTIIVRPIHAVGWTLFLEVIFYLIFALAMKISYKHRNLITLAIMVMLYIICSLTPGNLAISAYRDWIPYFVIGILTAMAWPTISGFLADNIVDSNISASDKKLPVVFSAIIKILIVACTAKVFGRIQFVIIPVMVFYAFLVMSYNTKTSKALSFLGSISYELYLTHEYIVKGFSRLVYPLNEKSLKTFCIIFVLTAIAIIIATVVHKIISYLFSPKKPTPSVPGPL